MTTSPRPHAINTAIALITGVLLFFLQMQFGTSLNGSSLDSSWQEILNWGITHEAQWGKDLVFTYGPLGFVGPDAPFQPSLYKTWLVLQIGIALFLSALVCGVLRREPIATSLAYLAATMVYGLAWTSSSLWIVAYPLSAIALSKVAAHQLRSTRDVAMLVALAAFGSLLPLVKFSAFPLWLLWVPLMTVMLALSARRLLALVFLGSSLATPVIGWLLCGQQLRNLPSYIGRSWEVAVYYGKAMQMAPARTSADVYALAALIFVLALIGVVAWLGRRSPSKLVIAILLAATAGLSYRAGTLRADGGHLLIYWSISAWVCALAIGQLASLSRWRVTRSWLAFFIILIPLAFMRATHVYPKHTNHQLLTGSITVDRVKSSLHQIFYFDESFNQRVAAWKSRRELLRLPGIASRINTGTTDLIMNDQGYLLANDFNYRPRPVFQSYSVYSDRLSRLNEDFLLSNRAPHWIIARLETIDGRYPNSDDARALVRMLQLYRPVFKEDQFLLFERSGRTPTSLSDLGHRSILPLAFDKPVDVSPQNTAPTFARFDVELTLFGKLITLMTREPPLFMKVEYEDGAQQTYRIVRAIAQSGFMLIPALPDQRTYLDWLLGRNTRHIVRLTLLQQHWLGQEVFTLHSPLELSPIDLPREASLDPSLLASDYPGFNLRPASWTQEPRRWPVDGAEVLNFQAPATITFNVPPGVYDVSARFGLNVAATTNPSCLAAHPDGIGLVAHADLQDTITGASYINPFAGKQAPLTTTYSRKVTVQRGQQLHLTATIGPPGSNGGCDWAWIRDVLVEPVTP